MPARKIVRCCTDGSRSPSTTVAEAQDVTRSSPLSREVVMPRGWLLLDEDRSMKDGNGTILAVRSASVAPVLLDGCVIGMLLGGREGSEWVLAPVDWFSERW